ncbi:mandelate racemase/muconate lactonizing enzyme family protein [Halalkalibacter krulwichiae]|uniref:Mandelate racemase n=1 Tax=Halalkalibacter krulwichiae TaxID=199441 RepID=A0A1X9M5Z7_9BACI|nr:mandelate racemase/muconate lactonizing enzyme family protein [Halalkalibacter krulwichiae]ARK28869.1 Mandelate racemase [Halalkalibacter krulwichiae]
MKITDMTVKRYVRMGKSDMAFSGHEVVVVEIETDRDITGIGFLSTPIFPHGVTSDVAAILLKRNFKNIIMGENPLHTEKLWKKMFDAPWRLGMGGMIRDCIAAIDFALWDIKAKLSIVPLAELFGYRRDKVLTYANVGHQLPPEELAAKAAEYVEKGHTAIKIRAGSTAVSIKEANKRVEAVREAIGPDVKLMVDINGSWDTGTAIQQLKKWEKHNLYWMEEPVSPEDINGYAKVREYAGNTYIAGGEQNSGLQEFRQFIEKKAIDIIQPNAMATGGITDWLKIYHFASAHNIAISPWNLQQIHIHLAAGHPNVKWIEYFATDREYFQDSLIKGPELTEERGEDGVYLVAPQGPGIGIEIDEDIAERTLIRED